MTTSTLVLVVYPTEMEGAEYFEPFLLVARDFPGSVLPGHQFYAPGAVIELTEPCKHGSTFTLPQGRVQFFSATVVRPEKDASHELLKNAFRSLRWEVLDMVEGYKQYQALEDYWEISDDE